MSNAFAASVKLNTIIHAADKKFGGLRPGLTADQSTPINDAIEYAKENGGIVVLPPWTIRCKNLRFEDGVKPWGIRGAGVGMTVLEHFDGAGNFLANPTGSTVPYSIEDMTISGRYAATLSGSANNLIVVSNTNGVRLRRLRLVDFKEAAILAQDTTASPGGNYSDLIVEDVEIDGGGVCNVGANIANYDRSGFIRVRALNGNKAGTPGFGIQFKDEGYANFMLDCYSAGWAAGFANGGSGVAASTTIRGCKAFNCDNALSGTFVRSMIELDADMNDLGQSAVNFTGANTGNRIMVSVSRLAALKAAIRFETGSDGNSAVITNLDDYAANSLAAIFDTGATNNRVHLENTTNEPGTVSVAGLVTFGTPANANAFTIQGYPTHEDVTIASGVATIRNAATTSIRVDTEGGGASDDLDTVTHPLPLQGLELAISTVNSARDVTLTNAGNLTVNGGGATRVLDNAGDVARVRYSTSVTKYAEASFQSGGA